MKNTVRLAMSALFALMTASHVEAQKVFDHVFSGESFVVATELNGSESYHYTAKKIIELMPGFSYTAAEGKEARFDVSSGLSVNYDVALYPNPAANTLHLSCDTDGTMSVMDVQGSKIMERNVTKGHNEIDVSALGSGLYVCRIDGKTWKFVKD